MKKLRSRRDRGIPRARSIRVRSLSAHEIRMGALMYPPVDEPRPCPWVACKHHLYLDVDGRTGTIKVNFPDLEPWELAHTCSLDVAERGGTTLEEVGEIMNLTRERIRQVEVRGLLALYTQPAIRGAR